MNLPALCPPAQIKIGVAIPTFRRPDFARFSVLQWLNQRTKPDVIVVHQNGNAQRYDWCVSDVAPPSGTKLEWIHSPTALPQHEWYVVPIRRLLDLGCTHLFWADHDDLFFADHVTRCVSELEAYDITVAHHCDSLYLRPNDYRFFKNTRFESHAPGGMSSSMAFTAMFAHELLADIARVGAEHHYTDNIVAKVTAPKFRRLVSESRKTTAYVVHEGSQTSSAWLDDVFGSSSAD
jgi:hypothetical protein